MRLRFILVHYVSKLGADVFVKLAELLPDKIQGKRVILPGDPRRAWTLIAPNGKGEFSYAPYLNFDSANGKVKLNANDVDNPNSNYGSGTLQ